MAQSTTTDAAGGTSSSSAAAIAPKQLDQVVVRGEYIPEPMLQTSEVASFVTREDMERTGDSSAAVALTRVTGLSLSRGKYVYVRGLGERYSSALFNGSPLPSPEPMQRVVPLDLFPSDVLQSVTVQDGKAFVMGTTPGYRAAVDLSEAPSLEHTNAQLQSNNASQQQQVQEEQQKVAMGR